MYFKMIFSERKGKANISKSIISLLKPIILLTKISPLPVYTLP